MPLLIPECEAVEEVVCAARHQQIDAVFALARQAYIRQDFAAAAYLECVRRANCSVAVVLNGGCYLFTAVPKEKINAD